MHTYSDGVDKADCFLEYVNWRTEVNLFHVLLKESEDNIITAMQEFKKT